MFLNATQHRTQPGKQKYEEHENPFSNNVLIGNWFEERFADKIDRKAITPGTHGESQCSRDISLYKSDFQQPVKRDDKEEYEEFIRWKQTAWTHRLHSQENNYKMWDGDQFARNLTTFNDIMFRIVPQKERPKSRGLPLVKARVNDDYMRSFGNSTKTGLLQWRECEKRMNRNMPVDVSHYKNNFKPIKITKRITLHKASQRKTTI